MRKSKVLNELKNGNFVGLPHIWTIPHWKIVDLLGYIGFPGVWIENEHGDFSEGEISQMILAARAHDMDAIVRIPRRDYTDTIKVLEAGATGVIVPHCMGVDDAKEIVKNARFHPIGLRGQGGSVDAEYHVNFNSAEYFKNGNSEIFLAVMIEDKEAVDEVEQIAALDGIDLILVGPGDLAQSYGVIGEMKHPIINEAIDKVATASKKHGKFWGTPALDMEYLKWLKKKGFLFTEIGVETDALINFFTEAKTKYS